MGRSNDESIRMDYPPGYFYVIFSCIIVILLALDLCAFYLYSKLAAHYEARKMADTDAGANFPEPSPPPVWTPDKGLTERFVEKFGLTPREKEVAELAIQGKSNKEIAAALNIKFNTVDVHLRHVYGKTGAQGRFALMSLCTNDTLGRQQPT
jgi:DNA-binding CsgD family transcriptional regulator